MKKTLGSVAGGIGLLLTLTSVVTYAVTVGSLVPFFVKLALGVLLLGVWAVTAGERAASWARSAFFYSSSIGLGLAFVGVLVAANFIAAKKAPSWDLTVKKVFSLSPQTESTLRALQHPVRVIAFIEGPVPEPVEALFRRYQAVSDRFSFEFKDPRRAPDLTQRYQVRQGQPVAVLISQGPTEAHATLNLTRLANPLIAEQELTNGILKLEKIGEQRLYFLSGHGEIPLEPLSENEEAVLASLVGLKRLLQDEGYAPAALNLVERGEVPADASAVVIAGPRSRLAAPEQKALADYLERGGRLLLFTEAQAEPGLDELLARYGVQVEPGIVADSKVNPEEPYIVYTPFFGDHEITKPSKQAGQNVVFATSRALTLLKSGTLPELTVTALVTTTPYAWVETRLDERPARGDDERQGQLALAAAVSRPVTAPERRADEARLLVFGDSDVLTGTLGYEPNRNLVLNGFAWATQQLKKITIRPPDRDLSTIDLDAQKLGTVRFLAMDLLPTLLMAVGLTIWQARRTR